ncbi:hypothetical protein MGWOODY_XGa205 [hydrothermal vent metagenome]|uniref:Uncharacterized protein n=1 Tax=hydrothermal vent metagenome TaxID=652676 RepID=A0A160TS87_9ZZZZ
MACSAGLLRRRFSFLPDFSKSCGMWYHRMIERDNEEQV